MDVLLIEDHQDIAENISDYLSAEGCRVDTVHNGLHGLQAALAQPYDAIVLDRMLPALDGLSVVQQLRAKHCAVPVLMVTALDAVPERVAGLGAGADDYLVKPFALAELHARLLALQRRNLGAQRQTLQVDDLRYDPIERIARRGDRVLQLNPSLRTILEKLMRASPAVVSQSALERLLWGSDTPEGSTLRTHIYLLRNELDRGEPRKLLHTLYREGYCIAARR